MASEPASRIAAIASTAARLDAVVDRIEAALAEQLGRESSDRAALTEELNTLKAERQASELLRKEVALLRAENAALDALRQEIAALQAANAESDTLRQQVAGLQAGVSDSATVGVLREQMVALTLERDQLARALKSVDNDRIKLRATAGRMAARVAGCIAEVQQALGH